MSSLPPNEGTDTLAIGDEGGVVYLRFEKPVLWVALDPETGRQVAEKIARSSYKARFGDDPTTQARSAITDAKVATCRIRVRKMLDGMEGTENAIKANAIVDAILTEVL